MMSLKEMKQILTHYVDQKLLKTLSDKEVKNVFDMVSDTVHFYPITIYESRPTVERVIFNDPATIVFFSDGTKSVVKCQKGEKYSKESGLSLAIAKRMLGNKEFHKTFKKFVENSDDISLNDSSGKTSIIDDKTSKKAERTRQKDETKESLKRPNNELKKMEKPQNNDNTKPAVKRQRKNTKKSTK